MKDQVIPRTFSLKTKDGVYAYMWNDGTERFPGVVFQTPEEAEAYFESQYGRKWDDFPKTYVKFDPTLPPTQ